MWVSYDGAYILKSYMSTDDMFYLQFQCVYHLGILEVLTHFVFSTAPSLIFYCPHCVFDRLLLFGTGILSPPIDRT